MREPESSQICTVRLRRSQATEREGVAMPTQAFCGGCGAELSGSVRFCTKCGAPIGGGLYEPQVNFVESLRRMVTSLRFPGTSYLIGGVGVILVGISYFAFVGNLYYQDHGIYQFLMVLQAIGYLLLAGALWLGFSVISERTNPAVAWLVFLGLIVVGVAQFVLGVGSTFNVPNLVEAIGLCAVGAGGIVAWASTKTQPASSGTHQQAHQRQSAAESLEHSESNDVVASEGPGAQATAEGIKSAAAQSSSSVKASTPATPSYIGSERQPVFVALLVIGLAFLIIGVVAYIVLGQLPAYKVCQSPLGYIDSNCSTLDHWRIVSAVVFVVGIVLFFISLILRTARRR
jgi:ribosomal protein L37AE/L43A